MRVKGGRARRAAGGLSLGSSPGRTRGRDAPDRRGPPSGDHMRERRWEGAGLSRERRRWAAGLGRTGGKEKRKGKVVWAGPKEIGKEREVSIYFFQQKIRTIQFKFKFKRI